MSKRTIYVQESATAWVCTDCYLAVAGYGDREAGRALPEPFGTDDSVVDVTNGSDPTACDACQADGVEWDGCDMESVDAHAEHDHDSFSLAACEGCGDTLAGDRYAVTIEIQHARTIED